ncbi:GNAT family N-acetyltransferase [Cryptosporangium arvum]|uniref:GNAT family N-acetyltransferase n=1 Tax=Cryptosporangium arvum TaxID=80871 RepID=UPI0004BBC476|nr:GNAT family N-acetyltransferase [Cryptosporangium arvum]
MSLALRPAADSDARSIAEIHVAGWQAGYRDLIDNAYLNALSVDARYEVWRRILAGGAGRVLLAEEGPCAQGFIAFGPANDRGLPGLTGEIYALYVDPRMWGRGTGGRLLGEASAELARAGRRSAVLWVFEANVRARLFYERYGWKADGGRRVERENFSLAEVRYQTQLN